MKTVTTTDADWLANAVKRQVARFASAHFRKPKEHQLKWKGLCEQDVVRCVQAAFDGAGYFTWLEHPYPGTNNKIDLWAESALPRERDPDWLVEVKALWDGNDNRLGIKRFQNKKEVLKDFSNLGRLAGKGVRVVVWVVFSSDGSHVRARKDARTYWLGNVIDVISRRRNTVLATHAVLDAQELADCESWRFAHVLVWSLLDGE